MVGAVDLAVAVAGFAVSAGAASVPQLLLLVPSLVLVFVVQHGLEVHHRPGVPGLCMDRTHQVKVDFLRVEMSSVFVHDVIFQFAEGQMSTGGLLSDPNR